MKTFNLPNLIDRHWKELFDKVVNWYGDDLHDLVIEVKTKEGETFKRSWAEREERLKD